MDASTLALAKKHALNLQRATLKDMVSPSGPEVVMIEDFGVAADWTTVAGTAAEDAANVRYGAKSLKLTADSNVTTIVTKAFAANKDLSGKTLLFSFYVDDATNLYELYLDFRVGIGSFGNNLSICLSSLMARDKCITDGWNMIAIPIGIATISSGLTVNDWSRISGLRLKAKPDTGVTVNVTFDGLLAVPNPQTEGLITLGFDDGCESVASVVFPMMSAYGYRGVSYVIPSLVGTSHHATAAQLKMLEDYGWDIASHTYGTDALNGLTAAQVEEQCASSYEWLARNGFSRGIDHLAYPGNDIVTPDMQAIVPKYYTTGRMSSSISAIYAARHNALPVADRMKIRAVAIDPSSVLTNIEAAIDAALAHKMWLVLYAHGFLTGESVVQDASRLQTIVDYIHTKGAKVVTMSDVCPRLGKPNWMERKANLVGADDIEVTDTAKGVILKSADGTRYRLKVGNDGALSTEAVT